jgi:hypothetical protein
MSTDFRPLTPIRMEDLFDGRLEDVGVYEHHSKDATSHNRCLTDGVNFLWVHSNEEGLVSTFTRWAPNGEPQRILCAIADQFDVDIVSEYEPQYWGCETEEEERAFWDELERKNEKDFYNEVIKFVRGEDHNIKSGTIEMIRAEIVKRLIAENPHCQSASKFDPRSASNFDPLKRRARVVALAPSELVGVAETARARVGM